MKLLANAFLLGFLVDAVLSLLDDLLMVAGGSRLLALPRGLVGGSVLLVSLPIYVLLGTTPRLPWRIFLPPCLFLSWLGLGAMPLPVWLGLQGALLGSSLLKLVFAAAALLLVRRARGAGGWLMTDASLAGPSFSWRTAGGFTALNLLVILPASLAYLFVAASVGLYDVTAGFLRLDTDGLYSADRVYTRSDQTIHLIGMMHIGEESYYEDLMSSFPTEGAVILAEGVTDEQELLPEGISYERLAAGLGLKAQDAVGNDQHEVVRADVDVSTFSPQTLEILRLVSELLASESMLEGMIAYSKLVDTRPDVATLERIRRDLLESRNAHVFGQIEVALEDYDRVIVPWGALHMAGIEQMLLEIGFEPTEEREWRVLSW